MKPEHDFRLDEFLPYLLSVSANAVSDAVAATYRNAFGLKTPEWRLIAVTAEDGPSTPLSICQKTGMDKVTVSRAAMTLVERNLMVRTPNPVDQRSHLLTLTKAGNEVYSRVTPDALSVEAQIFDGFTDDEKAALKQLLVRVRRSAERAAQ